MSQAMWESHSVTVTLDTKRVYLLSGRFAVLNRKLTVAAIAFALIIGIFAVGSFTADAAKTVAFEYQLIGMRLQPRSEMVNGKKMLTAPGMTTELNFQGAESWD